MSTGEDLIKALRDGLGKGGDILTESAATAPYLTDLLNLHHGDALCVVRPASTEAVAESVRLAARHGVAVTATGGRTGFCGGAVPADGRPHIVISLERMRRIRALDTLDNVLIAEAGCTLADVREAADAADRLFPVSHGGEGTSQIGGMVATNAGGNNVLRYGMARAHVLGLEVVLADGSVWDGLRTLRKDNAGYDMKQLFIGAEGTLGIVTAAALALKPKPRASATALAAVASPQGALDLFTRLRERTGDLASAFELMPRSGLDLLLARPDTGPEPFSTAYPWLVLVELESVIPTLDLDGLLEQALAETIEEAIVSDAILAQSQAQRAAFWALREGLAEAQASNPRVIKCDTSVPVGATPAFVTKAGEAVEGVLPGAIPIPFGHVGDGNIHFNVRAPQGMATDDFTNRAAAVAAAVEAAACALGGSVSAEHGLGLAKREAGARARPAIETAMMRRIKAALDPDDLLNPGKVLPPPARDEEA